MSSLKFRILLLFLSFSFLFITNLNAQEKQQYGSVTGFVHDNKSRAPIENVSVFLSNTTKGDASNKSGEYIISKVLPGKYTLVASMMGYETKKTTINVLAGETTARDFKLKLKTFEFEAVEIIAYNASQWKKDLKKFKYLFLGNSNFARECEIRNPEIIDFTKGSRRAFTAKAQMPIILINKALGFEIEFSLEYFVASETELNYSGETRFSELEPENEKERLRWQSNRLQAYAGSMRHFLASVLSEKSTDEGFSFFALSECPSRETVGKKIPKVGAKATIHIEPGFQPFEKTLNFQGCLQVEYGKEQAEADYLRTLSVRDVSNMSSIAQISWIELLDPSVSVDTRGNLLYRNVLKKHGYWAWKRVGDLLPTDYIPGSSIPGSSVTSNLVSTSAIDSLENMLQSRSYEKLTGGLVYNALDELSFKDSDHEKIIDRLHTDIWDIIDETEREKWQRLKTNKEKADYLRQFWLIRDTTYGDKINERLNEHYYRLKLARTFYNSFTTIGYDDRGKIHVKYGAPDNRSLDLPSGGKSTETWVYETGAGQIIYDFVDKGLGYDLSYRVGESIVVVTPKFKFAALGNILSNRANISFKYAIAYNRFLDLSQQEDINYEGVLRIMESELKELTQEQYGNQANLPVSTSKIFDSISTLDFIVKSAIFRNNETEHELALAYGFKGNKIKRSKKENRSNLSLRTVIRNPALIDISSREDNLSVEEQDFDEHNEFIAAIQIPNEINQYYVLIDVNNPERKQRGIKDISVKVPPFGDGEFQLSSVIFAKNIKPITATSSTQNLKLTSSIVRNDLEIEMYPFSTLKRIKPIFVYFEIYNLVKGPDGKTHYQVEHSVQPEKKKGVLALVSSLNPFKQDKGSISITDVREGANINEVFWVQLDFGQLAQGLYDLIVKVTDINANKKKTSKIAFQLK